MKRVLRSSSYSAVSFDGSTPTVPSKTKKPRQPKKGIISRILGQPSVKKQPPTKKSVDSDLAADGHLDNENGAVHEVVVDARILDMENSVRYFLKKDSSYELTHENLLKDFLGLAQNFDKLLAVYNSLRAQMNRQMTHFGSLTDFQPSWN